jgi:hypothetical protein
MIRRLVRHDSAVSSLPWVVVLFAGLGVVAALLYGKESAYRMVSSSLEDPDDRFVHMGILAVQSLLWGHLLVGLPGRALPFHLGLPLAARTLWLARMAASVTALMVPMLVAFAAFYLVNPAATDSNGLTQGLNFLALLLVLPFLVQARATSANRADVPHPVLHAIAVGVLFIAAEGLVAAFRPSFALVGPAALILVGLLAAFTWRSLPESFELSSALAVGRTPRVTEPRRGLVWLERIPVVSPLALLNRALRLNVLVSLNLVGLAVGVLAFTMVTLGRGGYVQLYLLVLFQVLLFVLTMAGVPRVAHLPISRRRLFVQAVLPGVFIVAAVVAIGILRDPGFRITEALASRTVLAGVALYVLAWALLTAAVMLRHLPPPVTFRERVASRVGMAVLLALAALTVVGALYPVLGDETRQAAAARTWLEALGEWIVVPVGVAWPLLAAIAVALYLVLGALFDRIEMTKLQKGVVRWSSVDS